MKNHYIERHITDTTYKLLLSHDISKLKITDITEQAGVSRNSFYRYYDSVEDVVRKSLTSTIGSWYAKMVDEVNNTETIIKNLLDFCYSNKDKFKVLHQSGCDMIFIDFLYNSLGKADEDNPENFYKLSGYTGLIFGIVVQWITRDLKETPEEIYEYTKNNFGPILGLK